MANDPLQKYETSTMSPARSRIKNAGAALDQVTRPTRVRWLGLTIGLIAIIGLILYYVVKK